LLLFSLRIFFDTHERLFHRFLRFLGDGSHDGTPVALQLRLLQFLVNGKDVVGPVRGWRRLSLSTGPKLCSGCGGAQTESSTLGWIRDGSKNAKRVR
jgi:hypothetical protein